MTTKELIQYDLDAGRFNSICSNEETFKSYVFKKIEEAEKNVREELLNQPANQHDREVRRELLEELKPGLELWLLRLHNEPEKWNAAQALKDILNNL